MRSRCSFCVVFVTTLSVTYAAERLKISSDKTHFTYRGERIFLSGINQAYVKYGHDWGENQYYKGTKTALLATLNSMNLLGNTIRIWLHAEGQSTPNWDDHDDSVISLSKLNDKDGVDSVVKELRCFLDEAQKRQVFVIITLWNMAARTDKDHWRLPHLLWDDGTRLRSYLINALEPLVRGLKGHPALAAYDIINEMEGSVIPAKEEDIKCHNPANLTRSSWVPDPLDPDGAKLISRMHHKGLYHLRQIQRFINWHAFVIHHNDPEVLVTSGSWSPQSNFYKDRYINFYSDECLSDAGGISASKGGALDFYQIHTFDMGTHGVTGIWQTYAPALQPSIFYGLKKPIVIGKFSQIRGGGFPITLMFKHFYEMEYAGAWSWMATSDPKGDGDNIPLQLVGMHEIYNRTDHGRIWKILIDPPEHPSLMCQEIQK